MTVGQRIAVMNAGRVEQVATPSELYTRPATLFVARFVGSPSMNVIEVPLLDQLGLKTRPASAATRAGFRPHDVVLTKTPDGYATVAVVEPLGHAQILHLLVRDVRVVAVAPPQQRW